MMLRWAAVTAAEKLNLTSRRKGQASDPAPAHHSTCFRELIQKTPPPVPSCLLQAATRTKDSPNVGKVKVVLRVSPTLSDCQGQPPVLRIDRAKKRVSVCPLSFVLPDQAEVCAGVLADVIRCVLSGSDGCVLGLGCADVGSWSSMVGSRESVQKLGLIPCAISWLYSTIERRREKTWTDLTVSVSAVELCCGEEDTLRDLLGEVVPSLGSIQDSPKAHIRIQEDPIYGIQLRNHNRVKAPTAERAASLLDAAIAARRHNDFITYLSDSSIMFFTLHIQPPRTESSTIGKGCRSRSTKLTMIDVCSGIRGMNKRKPPYLHCLLNQWTFALSLHRGSKLSMLLRDSLAHVNCHTTVIAQVTDSLAHLQETSCTIQLASRIHRTQKKTKSTSCSPSGRSLTKDYERGPLSLRAFHSTEEVDVDITHFRLRSDERSGSDQSCDTVIQFDSEGLVKSKTAPRLTQPEFVPIIPSLHPNKADVDDPEFTGPGKECLKCDTFAELQERLGCIDGSETTMDVLKSSSKGPFANSAAADSQPQKQAGQQTSSETTQSSLSQGFGCSQTSVGENPTDGAFPGDTFQREDSGLYDCEECSATSSSEELLNQTHSLNVNCHSELPKHKTINSKDKLSSQEHQVKYQGTAATSSVAHQTTGKQENPEAADWFKADKRTSPVGKSSPISPSSSCSASHSLATSVIFGDALPNRPTEDVNEMRATITVTVQQPLDLKGQDELVFSMVEEVTISGAMKRGRAGGNIICIRDTTQSQECSQGAASSQPIRIISNVSDESASTGSSNTNTNSVFPAVAEKTRTDQLQCQSRKEKRFLPSFINPTLINTDVDCQLDGTKETKRALDVVKEGTAQFELKGSNVKCPDDKVVLEKRSGSAVPQTHGKNSDKVCDPPFIQTSYDPMVWGDSRYCNKTAENKVCGKRPRAADTNHSRDREHVYSSNPRRVPEEGEICSRRVGKDPRRIVVSPGCQENASASIKTGSLPRGWQNAYHHDSYHGGYMVDNHRDPRGLTSSTPCSPDVTLKRRQGRQHFPANHSLLVSSSQKHGTEYKQHVTSAPRKGAESLFETSSLRMNNVSGRLKSPTEDSSRLFSAKLEQLATRSNSLGRTPRDLFPTLDRDSSSTSMRLNEGEHTLPRASRSPRKNARSDQSHHFFPSEEPVTQSAKYTHSKLSAVGKLKMASPKVRRLSASSIKNLSLPHKALRQSVNRSASLSPDSKTVSFDQSSTCSSTKSAIQGFVNGRISDLLKERPSSPSSGGLDEMAALPSPYSRVTSPRMPDHLSGHASDTTSVLSGDLPPAMGKTSLYFSSRNSMVSSGYDSMVRDSEATGSSTSTRDSVSDRSGSLLSVARSSRSSRRRDGTGKKPPTGLSGPSPQGLNKLVSLYESSEMCVCRLRFQGPACFSAKLTFLEHRRQRISAVRAKYSNLRRELERAKRDLMLEPTSEVDSLEHLEALELVSARLERRLNLCKANIRTKRFSL
uniref:Kinesin motor domain-containing protein n=1 Tax=Mola mola TaxID=94237 RepID=A0A3Q4BKE6_MOLML